ncbi:MAG: DUF4185 domain-containing protein [Candidatus Binataceae bacterium]
MSGLTRTDRICGITIFILALIAPSAHAKCIPSFPYADGWLGGDRAYAIPLGAARDLWLFGDSFVGTDLQTSRPGSRMIYNAAAISTCRNGKWNIRYYYPKNIAYGYPEAFFDTGTDKYRFWPLDGFVREGTLFVFLVEIATTGNGLFDFKETGAKLAEIGNPADEPDRWKVKYYDLSSDAGLVPGVAAFVADRHAYFYAVVDRSAPGKQVILGRVPLDRLDSPAASVEYLARGMVWKKGLNRLDAEIIIDNAAPEFSVRYHAEIAQWVMVETDPVFPATEIGIRSASHPEGPWSSFRPLYEIPEMRVVATANPEGVFCYEAREHPELASSPDSLSITYACSSLSWQRQVGDLTLYRPQAISLPLR